jgi:hypothetical protein
VSVAGLAFNVYRLPVHQKILGKSLKFVGLGIILGYAWFRYRQALFDGVLVRINEGIVRQQRR